MPSRDYSSPTRRRAIRVCSTPDSRHVAEGRAELRSVPRTALSTCSSQPAKMFESRRTTGPGSSAYGQSLGKVENASSRQKTASDGRGGMMHALPPPERVRAVDSTSRREPFLGTTV